MALLVCFRNRHHVSPHPYLDCTPHTLKKSTYDTQILPNILPVAPIFSFTII